MIELSNEIMAGYVGGQAKILNHRCYQGEIRDINVDGKSPDLALTIEFSWLAQKDDSGKWKKADRRTHILFLLICVVQRTAERIDVHCYHDGELTTIFPPSEKINKLDPFQVEGLELTRKSS